MLLLKVYWTLNGENLDDVCADDCKVIGEAMGEATGEAMGEACEDMSGGEAAMDMNGGEADIDGEADMDGEADIGGEAGVDMVDFGNSLNMSKQFLYFISQINFCVQS